MNHRKPRGAAALLALGLGALVSCGTIDVPSAWRAGDISIDGLDDDWKDALSPIAGTGVSVGIRNDAQSVYVCLKVLDPILVAPFFSRGLTVWFDPEGGTKQKLGIKYPMGTFGRDLPNPFQDSIEDRNRTAAGSRTAGEFLEIYGPERGDMERFKRGQAKGVEAALSSAGGVFVYELKIPLAAGPDQPFAAAGAPGKVIGIGVLCEKPKFGRPMMGGGDARGGRVGLTADEAEPGAEEVGDLKIWLRTTLALPPKS